MKTAKTLMAALFAVGMLLGLAGMASAAAISCGGCHSTPPVDGDNCADNARALHGVHYNYSSSDMPKSATVTDKCAYCHTATTGTAPTATHNNNYINVTSMTSLLDFDSGTDTCTDACHNNNATTAPWGNYTAVTAGGIELSCESCHDDTTGGAADLSGAHNAHLTTGITVSGLGNGNNTDCDACHPDNTGDLWSGGQNDDGSVKAYPHASDGTNVATDNAALDAGITATRNSGATDTCANACHKNKTDDVWNAGTLACESCHYYEAVPTFSNNSAATVKLTGGHGTHFAAGKVCTDCHGTLPTDTAHVDGGLPVPTFDGGTANANVDMSVTWNGTTCSNTGVGCHGTPSTTPVWGTTANGCTTCHSYPDGSNWTANNGHAVQYDTATITNTHLALASTFDKLNDTYASVTGDSASCGKCHSGGAHNNGTINVAGSGNNYCGAGDFTITVTTTGSNVTCANVSCHSGKTTPNWW